MQKLLLILNAPPYGSERTLSALRLASALVNTEPQPELHLFLLSDAVVCALSGQMAASGESLADMLNGLTTAGADVRICRTCASARGVDETRLLAGVRIGTMPELAQWALEADKVISF